MVRCSFLLIHFLVVEEYELPKSTSHVLNVPLTLESWFISFFSALIVSLMMFCGKLLSELVLLLSTHDVTGHLTCRNNLSCNLILKIWKCNTRNIRKCHSASIYIFIFGKLFYIYNLIHIYLKPRILITSFLSASLPYLI